MSELDPNTINKNDSDITKGAKAGALFGHALASSIDEVGNGAANILSVAGHTVLGATSKLLGTGVGGAVQGVKAMFKREELTSDDLQVQHDLKMQRLQMKEEQRNLKAEFKAQRRAIKENSRKTTRRAKAEKVLAEIDES